MVKHAEWRRDWAGGMSLFVSDICKPPNANRSRLPIRGLYVKLKKSESMNVALQAMKFLLQKAAVHHYGLATIFVSLGNNYF